MHGAGGMPPVTRLLRVAVLGLCPLSVTSKSYWKFDEGKHHRRAIGKCKNWECPALQRPVRKPVEEFKPTAPKVCPNTQQFEMTDMEKALGVCCTSKYVCAQTCNVNFGECFETYWTCAERVCGSFGGGKDECLSLASHNDMHHLTFEKFPAAFMDQPPDDETCANFHKLQSDACDCVPQKDWEDYQKDRAVEFFATYEPDKLTKKGKVHPKFWKAWKGKRAQMFYTLTMNHPDKAFTLKDIDSFGELRPRRGMPDVKVDVAKIKKELKEKKRKKSRQADDFQKMEL